MLYALSTGCFCWPNHLSNKFKDWLWALNPWFLALNNASKFESAAEWQ